MIIRDDQQSRFKITNQSAQQYRFFKIGLYNCTQEFSIK